MSCTYFLGGRYFAYFIKDFFENKQKKIKNFIRNRKKSRNRKV